MATPTADSAAKRGRGKKGSGAGSELGGAGGHPMPPQHGSQHGYGGLPIVSGLEYPGLSGFQQQMPHGLPHMNPMMQHMHHTMPPHLSSGSHGGMGQSGGHHGLQHQQGQHQQGQHHGHQQHQQAPHHQHHQQQAQPHHHHQQAQHHSQQHLPHHQQGHSQHHQQGMSQHQAHQHSAGGGYMHHQQQHQQHQQHQHGHQGQHQHSPQAHAQQHHLQAHDQPHSQAHHQGPSGAHHSPEQHHPGSSEGSEGESGSGGGEANPSMMDMVTAAIATLGGKKGASLRAIKKFITEKYNVDFSNQEEKNRVTKAVQLGVTRKALIKDKSSYRLGSEGNAANEAMSAATRGQGMYGHPGMPGQPGQPGHPGQPPFMHQQFPMPGFAMHPSHFMHQGYFPPQGPHMSGQAFGFPPMDPAAMHGMHHPAHPGMVPSNKRERSESEEEVVTKKSRKKGKRRNKDSGEKRKGTGGLSKPMKLSPELAFVCGSDLLGRTEIVKRIWKYIKEHGCQDPECKRVIVSDSRLKAVFGVDRVDMFRMPKLISPHLSKPSEEEAAAAAEAQRQAEEAAAAENDANNAVASTDEGKDNENASETAPPEAVAEGEQKDDSLPADVSTQQADFFSEDQQPNPGQWENV